jgi:hypothetical protein
VVAVLIHINCILILLAQFQIWDAAITQVFVGNGIVKEGNSLMASIVNSGDFLLFKILTAFTVISLRFLLYRRVPKIAMLAASALTVFYAGVIAWNFITVFSAI